MAHPQAAHSTLAPPRPRLLAETAALLRGGFAAVARNRLMAAALPHGSLTVRTPDGTSLHNPGTAEGPHGEIHLKSWRALTALMRRGDLGFAEAYMRGEWDSPDLAQVVELAALNRGVTRSVGKGSWVSRLLRRRLHATRENTKPQARQNIEAHYDLGNNFYAHWLDAGMSYSSALYRTGDETLEEAQTAKQDRILDLLAPEPGHSVLEIGCGWGGLAERITARTRGPFTGLTLSPAQAAYARARLAAHPHAAQANIALRDYRDEPATYDRVVSIEMFEAVGQAYWPTFFRRLHETLKPGGRAVLQVITIAESRFETYLKQPDFIQHYIFPGGMLPTITILQNQTRAAGLNLTQMEHFGQSYAHTLRDWRRRFDAAWDSIKTQGFDETFRRKWRYYLAYCEGGFSAGAINVGLYTLERP